MGAVDAKTRGNALARTAGRGRSWRGGNYCDRGRTRAARMQVVGRNGAVVSRRVLILGHYHRPLAAAKAMSLR